VIRNRLKKIGDTALNAVAGAIFIVQFLIEESRALETIQYDLSMQPGTPEYKEFGLTLYLALRSRIVARSWDMPITLLESGEIWRNEFGQSEKDTLYWPLGKAFAQVGKQDFTATLKSVSDPTAAKIALKNWIDSYFTDPNTLPWCESVPHRTRSGVRGIRITEIINPGTTGLYTWFDDNTEFPI